MDEPRTPEPARPMPGNPVPGLVCPLITFDQVIGGKYKLRLLYALSAGPRRYGELRRSLVEATLGEAPTPRILSRELKDLAARGLVTRTEHPGVPPKVEYALTDLGESLQPLIREIGRWGVTRWLEGQGLPPAMGCAAPVAS
jgi:DNA-binding HxlR family transcriptional regulator